MSPFNAKDFLGALTNHATTKDRGNKNYTIPQKWKL